MPGSKHRASTLALLLAPLLLQPMAAADSCRPSERSIRIASFNVFLNRPSAGQLYSDLVAGDAQARAVAEILQRVRPDIVLLGEFDYADNGDLPVDADGDAVSVFRYDYLGVGQNGAEPIRYDFGFHAPVNTGVPSGFDLNNDGRSDGPEDALGYGVFPGQYGMLLLSRFPIDGLATRTFQNLRWQDMPGNLLPRPFYSDAEAAALPLSSKSHWDVPVQVNGKTLHVLAAHPTPPVFDGPEDRNGRRNFDEIRLWADYVRGGRKARYIVDDSGERGGLEPRTRFVILGDYNADPSDGDSRPGAIQQLVKNRRVNGRVVPRSLGGALEAAREGGDNLAHRGDPAADTSDFDPNRAGNLRIDYVLPSRYGLRPVCSGVFWPSADDPLRRLVGEGEPVVSSDHRLVWVDVEVR